MRVETATRPVDMSKAFGDYIAANADDHPILAELWPLREDTFGQIVAWCEDGITRLNYMQIQRDPCQATPSDRHAKLRQHAHQIEQTLAYGIADLGWAGTYPIGYCGGLKNLGLDAESAVLLVRRDIVLKEYDYAEGLPEEFLTEFTVARRGVARFGSPPILAG